MDWNQVIVPVIAAVIPAVLIGAASAIVSIKVMMATVKTTLAHLQTDNAALWKELGETRDARARIHARIDETKEELSEVAQKVSRLEGAAGASAD